MTQEEKELLLKDLCSRLPYGVIIQHPDLFRPSVFVTEKLEEYYKGHFGSDGIDVEFVKPYLRPMSSMTEEEKEEYKAFFNYDGIEYPEEYIDWLNKKMFAHQTIKGKDMFELGLAIEAPEGMYN